MKNWHNLERCLPHQFLILIDFGGASPTLHCKVCVKGGTHPDLPCKAVFVCAKVIKSQSKTVATQKTNNIKYIKDFL